MRRAIAAVAASGFGWFVLWAVVVTARDYRERSRNPTPARECVEQRTVESGFFMSSGNSLIWIPQQMTECVRYEDEQ